MRLCPRGAGPSSYRLFETMQMGRVPVVLSDQWVPPDGPAWGEFLIRVPEHDVLRLPGLLREHEPDCEARGAAARHAWEAWLSPDRLFGRICEACEDLLKDGRFLSPSSRWLCYLHFARPSRARALLRHARRRPRGRPAVTPVVEEPAAPVQPPR